MFIHIIERKATARLFEGSIFSHTQKTCYSPPKQKILQVTARLFGGRTFSHQLPAGQKRAKVLVRNARTLPMVCMYIATSSHVSSLIQLFDDVRD